MFWRKKDTITLDCYTNRADVYNNFPIVRGNETIPKWFKNLPTKIGRSDNKNTMFIDTDPKTLKNCPAVLDYYMSSIALPLWSDLGIRVSGKGENSYEWQYADLQSTVESHPPFQYGNFWNSEEYLQLKIVSPWRFVCSEKIKFLCAGPEWQFDKTKNINVLAGVLDFYHQTATHVNLMFEKQEQETTSMLEAGLPIYYFFPLTEKKVIIKNHLVSEEKFQRLCKITAPSTFENSYAKLKRLASKRNCPYKFDVED